MTTLFYLFIVLVVNKTFANKSLDQECNTLKLDGNLYIRTTIWNSVGKPFNLVVHKPSNTLFFGYTTLKESSDSFFHLGAIDLNNNSLSEIPEVKGGCAVAIDQIKGTVYLGGSEGIYTYNTRTKAIEFYKEKGKNIWHLFFLVNLFYISYPDQNLYVEMKDKFTKVMEFENKKIYTFHASLKNNDIFFANNTGFYHIDFHNNITSVFEEAIIVRQLVEDEQEKLFIVTNNGVSVYEKGKGVKKILDQKGLHGLALYGNDSFIISDEASIVMLTPYVVRNS